jgi:hypothetical protein
MQRKVFFFAIVAPLRALHETIRNKAPKIPNHKNQTCSPWIKFRNQQIRNLKMTYNLQLPTCTLQQPYTSSFNDPHLPH